ARPHRPDRHRHQHGGDRRPRHPGGADWRRVPGLCHLGISARLRRLPADRVRPPGHHLRPLLPPGPVGAPAPGREPLAPAASAHAVTGEGVMPVLAVEGVTISFGGLRALDHASLTLEAGELVGLIGPNGSGKTTLLNILSGHLAPDAGRVTLDGRDITGLRPEVLARLGVLRMFQLTRVFPRMSVLDNL